jgi:hypothetical protein
MEMHKYMGHLFRWKIWLFWYPYFYINQVEKKIINEANHVQRKLHNTQWLKQLLRYWTFTRIKFTSSIEGKHFFSVQTIR